MEIDKMMNRVIEVTKEEDEEVAAPEAALEWWLEEEVEEEEAEWMDVAEAEAEEEAVIAEKKGGHRKEDLHLLLTLASARCEQKMATKTTTIESWESLSTWTKIEEIEGVAEALNLHLHLLNHINFGQRWRSSI